MSHPKPYARKLNWFSPWTFKAVGLVIAGAAVTIVGLTITKAVSVKADSPQGGKFVGVRHEAASIPPIAAGVDSSCVDPQAPSSDVVVRNGVTVLSPQLRVPVIDLDSLQAATGSTDDVSPSGKTSNGQKRSRYTSSSHTKRHPRTAATRWKAYGLAVR